MAYTKRLFILLYFQGFYVVFAQVKLDFNEAVNGIYARQHNQVGYETLVEQLWEFYQHPIDLHKATKEDLKRLHLLSDEQIHHLFKHLRKNGPLLSYYELQAIPGFDGTTIRCLSPFIRIRDIYPPNLGLTAFISKKPTYGTWLVRYGRVLEKQKGYKVNSILDTTIYQGSADKIATRFRWNDPDGWSFGMAGRKYPGEPFSWDPITERYGFDFCTGYVMIEKRGPLKKLILGHYQVGYGQGLLLHSGFAMDKSAETIPVLRSGNNGFKPHLSFFDYGFRGVAATLRWKSLEQSFYYAYNSLDGKSIIDEEGLYTVAIQRNGLHRTVYEIKKKGAINEQVFGSTLVFQSKGQQAEVGLNVLYTLFDIPLRPKANQPAYSFSGKENHHVGFFYRYLWKNLHFFGEGALAKSGGKAGLIGVVASLTVLLDLSLLLRHYDPFFHSFYGDAFRENKSGNHNERGIYVGAEVHPIKKLKISAYYDYFQFPEPTSRIAQPSTGNDWLGQVSYQIDTNHWILLQYRTTKKARNIPAYTNLYAKEITSSRTSKYKLRFKQQITPALGSHSEIQSKSIGLLEELSWGYGLAQRVVYKLKKIELATQLAWFDTEPDNKLYFYEQAPLHSRPMPVLYYKQGIKAYLLICYKPAVHWRLEGRYAHTWLINEDKIGTGLDSIKGDTKNELVLQLIYKI